MVRKKVDHRGFRFGISYHAEGYAWQRIPQLNPEHDVLGPVGVIGTPGGGRIEVRGAPKKSVHRLGLEEARKAYNEFRQLAEALTHTEPRNGSAYLDVTIPYDEARALTVAYANRFGVLWGDNDPGTLRMWKQEAATFLDLLEVSLALRPRSSRTKFQLDDFEKRVIWPREGRPSLEYYSGRGMSRMLRIAHEGDWTEGRSSLNQVPVSTSHFERAISGTRRERAWMLFSRQINRKLAGGLSFNASLFTDAKATVTPQHLIHLLYLRLWIDTVEGDKAERRKTCLNCQREIVPAKTGRPPKYCSRACHDEYNNQVRARSVDNHS